MFNKVLAAAAVSVVALTGVAQAAPVTFGFDLFATLDNSVGNGFTGTTVGSGSISYDSVDIAGPSSSLSAISFLPGIIPDFDFEIMAFGQMFNDNSDTDAQLLYADGEILSFSLSISEGDFVSPTAIDDDRVLGFATFSGVFNPIAGGGLSVDVAVNDVAVAAAIPLPAGALLLMSGLAGLGAASRRRRRT